MKLRLQGSSLRLRVKRSEVERLCDTGAVEESVEFGRFAPRDLPVERRRTRSRRKRPLLRAL